MEGEHDLVAWAERTARKLLASLPNRLAHTEGVAARARIVAEILPKDDRAALIAAAWLHDIGYSPELASSGLHATDGATYLQQFHVDKRLASLVAYHSGARFEAQARGLPHDLDHFPPPDARLLDALTWCDMTVSPDGMAATFDERISEVLSRYPSSHPVHGAVAAARSHLKESVERVDSLIKTSSAEA